MIGPRRPSRAFVGDAWRIRLSFGLAIGGVTFCLHTANEQIPSGAALTNEFPGPTSPEIRAARLVAIVPLGALRSVVRAGAGRGKPSR